MSDSKKVEQAPQAPQSAEEIREAAEWAAINSEEDNAAWEAENARVLALINKDNAAKQAGRIRLAGCASIF